jgi:hypothetical protein
MVTSFIRGLAKWPSADLAEIVIAIQHILHQRAERSKEVSPKASRKATQHAERK